MCATVADDPQGKLTVGLDVGDTYTQTCVLDEVGAVIEEGRVATTPKAFRRRFAAMPPARLVLEAGNHSHWASRLLGELDHEVIVANPRMLRFIYGSDSKNDKADAAYLARVGKLDPALLHPVVHRSEQSGVEPNAPYYRALGKLSARKWGGG
jgi:transposase